MKKNFVIRTVSVGLSALLLVGTLSGCAARQAAVTESDHPHTTQAHSSAANAPAAAEEAAPAAANAPAADQEAAISETYAMQDSAAYSKTYELSCAEYPEFIQSDSASGEYDTFAEASGSFNGRYRSAYGGDYLNSEEYTHLIENGYKSVAEDPLSTFSADVDTASYTNVRRMLYDYGYVYDTDAVRLEEMINYFDYDYALPSRGEVFGVTTQYTDCPWNPDADLLLVGVKTDRIDLAHCPDNNLVFLIDVSGSMYDNDKLPLLQKSFSMLAKDLTEKDRVSIVTYAGYETVVLDGERGDHTSVIINAINDLEAGGSTAGEAGIKKAYKIAEKNYIKGGNNRIILATDGDLNVGVSSVEDLNDLISGKRDTGVFLSVLGVGSGNIKDNKMETLADNGNGNYSYIDSLNEAKKVLVDEMGGTLITVAKDVKFQVEFNPEHVKGYRLVGYENRMLSNEDFNDDTVDAGEIGAGHTVTALYEIIPVEKSSDISLKYQPDKSVKVRSWDSGSSPYADELLTVSVRYKEPDEDVSKLRSYPVIASDYTKELPAEAAWASAVAEFGMLLKGSEFAGTSSIEDVLKLAEDAMVPYRDSCRLEFYQLAAYYAGIVPTPQMDDMPFIR